MVRGRRTRTKNIAAAATSAIPQNIEDNCCASPKRKDLKLDKNVAVAAADFVVTVNNTTENLKQILHNDYNNADIGAKNRSQSITNYFQVQAKSFNNPSTTSMSNGRSNSNTATNESINVIDENARDAFSTATINSITTTNTNSDNIFLQAPVLHLNIDKSPNQPSSIVINKNIDFSTINQSRTVATFPTNTNTATIKQAQSSTIMTRAQLIYDKVLRSQQQQQQQHRLHRTADATSVIIVESDESAISSDSNSCDSGVVIDNSLELSPSKRRKPTTPHRIVCPSPVKQHCTIVDKNTASQLSNLNIGPKRGPKSKRRLNVNQIENFTKPIEPTTKSNGKKGTIIQKKTILNAVADPTAKENSKINTNNNNTNNGNSELNAESINTSVTNTNSVNGNNSGSSNSNSNSNNNNNNNDNINCNGGSNIAPIENVQKTTTTKSNSATNTSTTTTTTTTQTIMALQN